LPWEAVTGGGKRKLRIPRLSKIYLNVAREKGEGRTIDRHRRRKENIGWWAKEMEEAKLAAKKKVSTPPSLEAGEGPRVNGKQKKVLNKRTPRL